MLGIPLRHEGEYMVDSCLGNYIHGVQNKVSSGGMHIFLGNIFTVVSSPVGPYTADPLLLLLEFMFIFHRSRHSIWAG